jgi:N-acetylglucosaminyl-diphospho-decaprenol L-rhamnosyltransferase
MMMDLSILIVTYNSAALIDALLQHLFTEIHNASFGADAEVVLVDNGSHDGTADLVAKTYPWVKLVPNQTNLGFAAGNNLAAQSASGRYLLLLNPDAMPAPGALARGIALMDAHPDVGMAGGELRNVRGEHEPSARMFPTLRDEFFTMSGLAAKYPLSRTMARLDRRWADPEIEAAVDWVPGAFVLLPRHVFQNMAGFDERFFMYYEEVDLCRRLHSAGYRVLYWPELKATHIGGASAKTVATARISRHGSQLESWRMRSAMLYYRKHHGLAGAFGLMAIEWLWHRLRGLRATLGRQSVKAHDMATHCSQLRKAWSETRFGQTSPIKPW